MPNRAYELSGQETLDEIAKFSPEMQQTKELTELKTSAEQKLKTGVGRLPYIDIIANNAGRRAIIIKSVIDNPGQQVHARGLLGFIMMQPLHGWGSAQTDLRQVPQKGFEIYGVSVRPRPRPVARRRQGQQHVVDSCQRAAARFDNQAAKDYAVQGIPSNFLIDARWNIWQTCQQTSTESGKCSVAVPGKTSSRKCPGGGFSIKPPVL